MIILPRTYATVPKLLNVDVRELIYVENNYESQLHDYVANL